MNLYYYSVFTLTFSIIYSVNGNFTEQRSKEANCLIIGYQKCIINYFNISQSELNENRQLIKNKNSATDCWRISRTNDKSQINCGEKECLWGGGCVNSEVDENDGYHTTENLPISAFYDDAHTITISFPTYLDTVLYVLESRLLATDGKTVHPWTFAGVSNETSISYRILDICQKYEFRPTAILNNGTLISFLPKVPTANPPDFIVESLKLDKLYYEESDQKAMAVFRWKTPYGYTMKDVVKYDSYIHPTQCDLSGEYDIKQKLIKTEDGGAFQVEFPENMIKRKCRFLITVWAHNVCGSKTVADVRTDLELSCSRIEGYKCPNDELKPKCISHIVTTSVAYDSSSKLISVNASWLPSMPNTPQYYHVKWGPADLVDMQRKPPPPPPPPQTSNDIKSQMNFDSPQGFPAPPPPPLGPPPHSNRGFDLSVWILRKDVIRNEKVDGASSTVTLTNVHMNENYGLQVCAIFNADFRTPDWPVVPVSGFTCLCSGNKCDSGSSINCEDPDWFKLNKAKASQSGFVATATSSATTTRLPMPAPQPPGIPVPSSIGPVEDFTQSLVGWEYSGLRMTLNWNPPTGFNGNQMLDYRVSLESLNDCNETQICCNFAKFPDVKQEAKNNSQISLLVSKDVLRANCRFMVKIIAIAVNGAQSISLKNIIVPKPVVDPDLPLEAVATDAPVMKMVSQNVNLADKIPSKPNLNANLDRKKNSSSKIISITANPSQYNCSHLQCTHSCNEDRCLCPADLILLSDNKTCVEDSVKDSVGFFISDASLALCQELGCQYSCNSKNECICPSNMNLTENGKTCTYKDPDLKNITAPPPLSTTTFDSGIYCLQDDNQVSVVKTNWDIYISWNNQSWVDDRIRKNFKSPVIVRWGETKTIPFLNLHKLINETATSMATLSDRKLFIGRLNLNKQYGFQFCIFNTDKDIGSIDWKLATVLLLSPTQSTSSSRTRLPETSSDKDDDPNDSYVKKIIVMAVVIPLCSLIIIISLSILLCHFYPRPLRLVAAKLCSKKSCCATNCNSTTTTNDQGSLSSSTDKTLSTDKKINSSTLERRQGLTNLRSEVQTITEEKNHLNA